MGSGSATGDAATTGGSGSSGRGSSGDGGAPVAPPQVPAGWKIALDDEFNGDTLGPNWALGTHKSTFTDNGTTYWTTINGESGYVTASMVKVQDGNLILSAAAHAPISGPEGTKSYVFGYVTSFDKFTYQYGYIELRVLNAAVAAGSTTGLWPALWTYRNDWSTPPHDEIDVFESFCNDQRDIQMTAQPSNRVKATVTTGVYHTFGALHKEDGTIAFYIDDKLQMSFSQTIQSEMAILMGMQLGRGDWCAAPAPDTWPGGINGPMTADIKVDWVHVWTP
jgi:beta-glucanase (GH16 family)